MRPKRRPPRPKHPKFTHFHRSGLRFGRFPAQHRSIGGVGRPRRDRRAWLRCPWAVAGPGRASRRRAERSSRRGRRAGGPLPTGTHSGPAQQNWPRGGRAWPGFEIDHSERSSRVAISRAAGPDAARNTSGAASNKLNRKLRLHRRCEGRKRARLRCPWAAAGPGRGARGRRRGLAAVPVGGGRARAGLEIDHSEPQARVWRSRGRAAAHRHTQRPDPTKQPGPTSQARRRPEHPWGPQAARPSERPTTTTTRRPRRAARAGTGRGSG